MRNISRSRVLALWTIIVASGPLISAEEVAVQKPNSVHDILWVWGIAGRGNGNESEETLATFGQASPARRAQLLRVPNIIMAGSGIPNDQPLAREQTDAVRHAQQIVWEILPDGEIDYQHNFDYSERAKQVRELVAEYPQIKGVLLDDMTSVAIRKGFKPEHIQSLREHLRDASLQSHQAQSTSDVKIWGVVYTMNFDQKNIDAYINELDVINLWVWQAEDLASLEQSVTHCKQNFPSKPVVLGLYLYDYGNDRPLPLDAHRAQCETALKLAHAGQITGIVFLTNDKNDIATHNWTADWIRRVGDQSLGSP